MEARTKAARAEYRGLLWGRGVGGYSASSSASRPLPLPPPHGAAPPPWGLTLRQEREEEAQEQGTCGGQPHTARVTRGRG